MSARELNGREIIGDIEALRAVAVVLVIFTHANWFWTTPETLAVGWLTSKWWVGVDLFFVISGFVITRNLLELREHPHPLKRFWIRRLSRIQPLAIIWLAIGLLFSVFLNSQNFFGPPIANTLEAAIAFFQVYNFYKIWLILTEGRDLQTFVIYWSLSMEEQFYLIFPLLLLYLPRRALVAGAVILIAVQFPLDRPVLSAARWIRTDGLMWGVLIALFFHTHPNLGVRAPGKWPLRLLMFAALTVICVIPDGKVQSTVPLSLSFVTLACATAVFLASMNANLLASGWCRDVLLYIGSRSYGLYLSHWLCFKAVTELFHQTAVPTTTWNLHWLIAGLAMSVIATEILYRFVEVPLRRYGRDRSNRLSHSE